jgi:hypothetical protein
VATRFLVYPRPGHAGLAHMVIRYHEHIVAPTTEGMSLAGDTFPIDWDDQIDLEQPPHELVLEGWNEDDTFEHSFYIAVVVVPRSQLPVNQVLDALKNSPVIRAILRLLGVK